MSTTLRAMLIVLSVFLLAVVIRLVSRKKLQLKYSLLWLFMGALLLISALFPGLVGFFAHLFGVELTSNFVFIVGMVFLLGISMSLTYIASWQSRDIRKLIQRMALLEKRLGETDSNSMREEDSLQSVS